MKILLHIGAHKTGTKLLQRHLLFVHGEELAEHNVVYGHKLSGKIGSPIKRNEGELYDKTNLIINTAIDKLNKKFPGGTLILSCEKFIGQPLQGYRTLPAILKSFKKVLFDKHDVEAILFVRRQDTFIESYYSQSIKRGHKHSFEKYLESIDMNAFKWDKIADQYNKQCPIYVFPYEDLLCSPQVYWDNFLSPLGISIMLNEDLPVENPSLTADGVQKMLCRDNDDDIKALRADLEKSNGKDPKKCFGLLSDSKREEVLDYYYESNKRLFEKYIDLYDISYYYGDK